MKNHGKINRMLALLLALLLLLPIGGCARAKKTELHVFAAASLTETLDALITLYQAKVPGVTVIPTYDSSGTLKTQIEEGAVCDLFLSAGQKQMDALEGTHVLDGSRINFLENRVVLVTPAGEDTVSSFDDMAQKLSDGAITLCMGNADVPVGQYTGEILASYGLSEEALAGEGRITYGSNVKEVTTLVSEAAADCGVIYATDLYSANLGGEILTGVDEAGSDMCSRVIYPAAVMKGSKNAAEAAAFLAFLQTPEAAAVFEAVGFQMA